MGKKGRVKPAEAELKILFAKSGNLCAFPECRNPIIAQEGDEQKPLAEMAHIIAYKDKGPRSDPSLSIDERNKASNFILLCPTHHTIVYKFEYQYNVHVLREMKRIHEERVYTVTHNHEGNQLTPLKREVLYASILPISHLPRFVFVANTPYRKTNISDLFDVLDANAAQNLLCAFELREKKLYTFFDLFDSGNPFRGAYEQSSVDRLESDKLWQQPDMFRLYITLLNRSLTNYLKKRGVAYDAQHYRYYFRPHRDSIERKFSYRSLAGRSPERSVVHQPITRKTGQPKPYWVHCAANLSFQQVAARQWVLTIRPERHLTRDGYEPYIHTSVGSKITRIKSKMYNWQYLQEIQLWREFLTQAKPRRTLRFGKQSITIENRLLQTEIEWVGVPGDDKEFVAQVHEEDLFTLTESRLLDEADNEFEEDIEEDSFLDEY